MDRPKECAFGIIKSTNGFHRIEAGTWPRYNSNWRSNDCKDGDKVLLHFDFVHSRAKVCYNGESVGQLTDTLPKELFLVVNVMDSITLETSDFRIVAK